MAVTGHPVGRLEAPEQAPDLPEAGQMEMTRRRQETVGLRRNRNCCTTRSSVPGGTIWEKKP